MSTRSKYWSRGRRYDEDNDEDNDKDNDEDNDEDGRVEDRVTDQCAGADHKAHEEPVQEVQEATEGKKKQLYYHTNRSGHYSMSAVLSEWPVLCSRLRRVFVLV